MSTAIRRSPLLGIFRRAEIVAGGIPKHDARHYNKVVSRVLEADWFTKRLFTPWLHYPELDGRRVPPVTVLSHSDIGAF
jgi:hypothetical protein